MVDGKVFLLFGVAAADEVAADGELMLEVGGWCKSVQILCVISFKGSNSFSFIRVNSVTK